MTPMTSESFTSKRICKVRNHASGQGYSVSEQSREANFVGTQVDAHSVHYHAAGVGVSVNDRQRAAR
jgi:hypothetical protein